MVIHLSFLIFLNVFRAKSHWVISLKSNAKRFLKLFFIYFLCAVVFIFVGFIYIKNNQIKKVQSETPSVPYYSYTPENKGILLSIGTDKTLFYLNFREKVISIVFADEISDSAEELYGYTIDYFVKSDYGIVEWIVDSVDGIELEANGEVLNSTGVQVVDILSSSADDSLRYEITKKIIKKIGEKGFEKEGFLYIIENSKTNLTIPDCYFWYEFIPNLCKNARYVN